MSNSTPLTEAEFNRIRAQHPEYAEVYDDSSGVWYEYKYYQETDGSFTVTLKLNPDYTINERKYHVSLAKQLVNRYLVEDSPAYRGQGVEGSTGGVDASSE